MGTRGSSNHWRSVRVVIGSDTARTTVRGAYCQTSKLLECRYQGAAHRIQEASHHHIDLVEEYNNVMETFANKYNLLNGVQLRFKSKIIQLTGLRDGVEATIHIEPELR